MNFSEELRELTFNYTQDIYELKKKYPQNILPTLSLIRILLDLDLDERSDLFHSISLIKGEK